MKKSTFNIYQLKSLHFSVIGILLLFALGLGIAIAAYQVETNTASHASGDCSGNAVCVASSSCTGQGVTSGNSCDGGAGVCCNFQNAVCSPNGGISGATTAGQTGGTTGGQTGQNQLGNTPQTAPITDCQATYKNACRTLYGSCDITREVACVDGKGSWCCTTGTFNPNGQTNSTQTQTSSSGQTCESKGGQCYDSTTSVCNMDPANGPGSCGQGLQCCQAGFVAPRPNGTSTVNTSTKDICQGTTCTQVACDPANPSACVSNCFTPGTNSTDCGYKPQNNPGQGTCSTNCPGSCTFTHPAAQCPWGPVPTPYEGWCQC